MRADLKKHIIAGFAIAVTVAVLAWLFLPAMPQPPFIRALASMTLGILVAHIVGRAKEYVWDRRHPQTNTVDRADWVATSKGGAAGGLIFMTVWFLASIAKLPIAG